GTDSRASAPFPKTEPLQLAGWSPRQHVGELDDSWGLVRGDLALDEVVQRLCGLCPELSSRAKDKDRLHDHPAIYVGHSDDGCLGDRRMTGQGLLALWARDVVAGRHDHVVGARLVMKVAVRVLRVHVARDVPAVPDVGRL